jgi:SH3 domain-containing YSC84-like protein 1
MPLCGLRAAGNDGKRRKKEKIMKGSFKGLRIVSALIALVFLFSANTFAASKEQLDMKIASARIVLQEMTEMPDTGIPSDLLKSCSGIAIFPSVIKGAFGIGGMGGSGIILYRDKETGQWSAPAFVSIGGASFGFQIGGQATDMILVIMSKRGMMSLSHANVTLGGDASVAAGPIGRNAQVDTTAAMNTGIFSYSRSKGLFAGVSLKGSVVGPQNGNIETYYGDGINAEDIFFSGKVQPTEEGRKLIDELKKYD